MNLEKSIEMLEKMLLEQELQLKKKYQVLETQNKNLPNIDQLSRNINEQPKLK